MTEPAAVHELSVTREPVASLRTYHRNPRQGALAAIRQSLVVNGQYRPLVVNRGTHTGRAHEVLAGNHTLKAARDLAWPEVAVCWVDVDDDQAARIVAADNRTADLGDYDERALAELLGDLPSLEGTGYDEDDLAALVASLNAGQPVDGATDPDDAPAVPEEQTITAAGDLWQLGEHRLVVGDATQQSSWDLLLGDDRADLVWTDPPYGVAYVGKTADALTLQNDALKGEALAELLAAALGHAARHSRPGACWYVAAPAGPLHLTFARVLADLDIWHQTLVWIKDSFVLGHSDYHYRSEPVFYGWIPGSHRPPPDRTQDNVHEVARPKASREHPTMKPVALIERHLRNSTVEGELVLDPFAGSGSTLVAAHRHRRRAALIELDPRYGDVICRRFQEYTGDRPMRDGEPVDFTTQT